jgi:hypothetical protein
MMVHSKPWIFYLIILNFGILACSAKQTKKSVSQKNPSVLMVTLQTAKTNGCDFDRLKKEMVVIADNPANHMATKREIPEYSKAIAEKGISGRVQVTMYHRAGDGSVVYVCAYTGPSELKRLAENAAMKWKYKPTPWLGKKALLATTVEFDFVNQ